MNARTYRAKCAATVALLLLIAACSAAVDRDHWRQMPPSDKSLYVSSMIGGERAKEQKGGNDRHFSRPVAEYVVAIDEAYARGDRRTPQEIFASFADRR